MTIEGQTVGLSITRYRFLPAPVKITYLGTTLAAVILFVLYWLAIPVGGTVISGTAYLYLLFAILGFNIFIGLGASRKKRTGAPPWYDYLLAILTPAIFFFFLFHSNEISMRLWTPPPSAFHVTLAIVLGILALEAGRRAGGWGYVAVLGVSIGYPLFADKMPGVLYGYSLSLQEIFADFSFGANGILGLPGAMLGKMVLGFYLFAGVMLGLGGGEFFLKLATALMGRVRGGPAKVAVLASGFFGSLTGSIIANIAATGSFTIPAMKKTGYSPEYSAATEACASSGGDTMPPVMGGLVFMAAIIANVDYTIIMVAAFIPTVLYYFGLLVQVDGYAAKAGIKALAPADIPRLWTTIKEGWIYLFCIGFLVFGLLYMRWGMITPVYASVLMLLLSILTGRKSFSIQKLESALAYTAGLVNFGIAIFLSMGFILVGLYKTGMAAALTAWVISLGAGNVFLILLIGAVFNLLMGMVGLQRTAYLFLAVTMAPAVAAVTGIPIIAVHLFIIFYAGLGGLTPPVAINAFIAASIAEADAMKTALISLRLGVVLIFIPFFFVLQPALVMQGTPWEILYHTALAMMGIFILASGLEGYLIKLGRLTKIQRVIMIAGGFLIAFPQWIATLTGLVLSTIAIIMVALKRQRSQPISNCSVRATRRDSNYQL
ncbi:MAG TPA: TRAP transporter fused permease subunit [Dehalococcoidia bacterium]|nr:TRAP transporter fused permease subunit [Dehalococcoidia bacterium]